MSNPSRRIQRHSVQVAGTEPVCIRRHSETETEKSRNQIYLCLLRTTCNLGTALGTSRRLLGICRGADSEVSAGLGSGLVPQSISKICKGVLGSTFKLSKSRQASISASAALSFSARFSVCLPHCLRSAGSRQDHFGESFRVLFNIMLKSRLSPQHL